MFKGPGAGPAVCGRNHRVPLGLKQSERGASREVTGGRSGQVLWPLQLCFYPESHGDPWEGWDLLWAGHQGGQVIRLAESS